MNEVAVSTVNLDHIEASLDGTASRSYKTFDNACNLSLFQRKAQKL
jgi:hypothetical protein